MSKLVTKHFRVLTKSWINNAIQEAGSIVAIEHDPDTWQPGPNLKEVADHKPAHTEAQKKAADEESERTKERLGKQEKIEEAEAKDKDDLKSDAPLPFAPADAAHPPAPPQPAEPLFAGAAPSNAPPPEPRTVAPPPGVQR
jgi:hypothetical protein